jgi:hypothetical protein
VTYGFRQEGQVGRQALRLILDDEEKAKGFHHFVTGSVCLREATAAFSAAHACLPCVVRLWSVVKEMCEYIYLAGLIASERFLNAFFIKFIDGPTAFPSAIDICDRPS